MPPSPPPTLPVYLHTKVSAIEKLLLSHFDPISTLWRKGDFSIQRNETVIARGWW